MLTDYNHAWPNDRKNRSWCTEEHRAMAIGVIREWRVVGELSLDQVVALLVAYFPKWSLARCRLIASMTDIRAVAGNLD